MYRLSTDPPEGKKSKEKKEWVHVVEGKEGYIGVGWLLFGVLFLCGWSWRPDNEGTGGRSSQR